MTIKKSKRPPLGIEPKHLWEEKRFDALTATICRYLESRWPLPREVVNEYNALSKKLEYES